MNKTKLDKKHVEFIDIDNGGISLEIEDKGPNEGIIFTINSQYFGYPSVSSSIRIDLHAESFFKAMEELIRKAKKDIATIDFADRFDG